LVAELRAIRALEGVEIVIADAPPRDAEIWCDAIEGTPHWRCEIEITELRRWIAEVVRYGWEIEALRGWPDCPKIRRWTGRCV
jgi:hypothetical protein